MKPRVRSSDPVRDAAGVAEFFNRNGYGPIRAGHALSGEVLNAILRERGASRVLVGEDRGKIVGTIGYLAVSGRRVARPGELFAGLFLIDPAYRTSFLAGQLVTTSFALLVRDGVRSLRIEVDPANTQALPLYGRIGFRALGLTRPDEDGYIELISYFPGVVADLVKNFRRSCPDPLAELSWRILTSGRGKGLDEGISVQDGEVLLSYNLAFRGKNIRVQLSRETGAVVKAWMNHEPYHWSESLALPALESARELARQPLGDFLLTVDTYGTLRLSHRRYVGPILTDHFPVGGGALAAWRRPRNTAVTFEQVAGGWRTCVGEITRELHIDQGKIRVTVRGNLGTTLTSFPWVGLRSGTFALSTGAQTEAIGGPIVRGLWPPDCIDFEASATLTCSALGAQALWAEPQHHLGMRTRWLSEGQLRVDSHYFPMARTAHGILEYEIELLDGRFELPSTFLPASSPMTKVKLAHVPDIEGSWQAAKVAARGSGSWQRLGVKTAKADNGSVDLVPQLGLISWKICLAGQSLPVLASPFPRVQKFGPLAHWRAGLWVTSQGGREDPEQGVEWGNEGCTARFSPNEGATPTWMIEHRKNDLSALRINLHGAAGQEQVVHLTPKRSRVDGPEVLFWTHDHRGIAVKRTDSPWRVFTRQAAFRLSDSFWLVMRNRCGSHPEILIRSTPAYLFVSLLTRASQEHHSSWLLAVTAQDLVLNAHDFRELP